ncbi:MAG: type II toxin-antitoxin system PemK/MazF family toxin [Ruminococcus sp.]|nr:type II toxin-antitoxin system PemK/MazF family toxin [Ruminococcus sp.]
MIVKRGDVFYADLDPIIGSEQGGIRPVLVVQNNVGNKYSPTVVVLPISSAKKINMPTHIRIFGSKMLPNDSVILAEQIRTIDRNRLKDYVGSVGLEIMKKVDRAMKISIGVDYND